MAQPNRKELEKEYAYLLKLLRENAQRIEGKAPSEPINLSKMARKLKLTNQSLFKRLEKMREEDIVKKRPTLQQKFQMAVMS